MIIKNIALENYRNYENEKICFHPQVNLITGKNAQGKTNLLESIYYTAIGKSFRNSKDRELIRFGCDFSRLTIEYECDGEDRKTEMAISKEGKKAARIDGRKIEKTSELLNNIIAVVFSPEDLKIIKEEPEKRRRFINREMSQLKLSYLNDLKTYNKGLLQRNAYLRENENDSRELDVWDEILISKGSEIMEARKKFTERLSLISGRIHSSITNGKEELSVIYRSNIPYSVENQHEVIRKQLYESRRNDLLTGHTGKGPHKDDIEIIINGKNARHYGSQGQQRTAALSLKLAEIDILKDEKKENPILLLDDVMSELDNERQRYLIDSLGGIQMFITVADLTDKLRNSLPDSRIITIKNGREVTD